MIKIRCKTNSILTLLIPFQKLIQNQPSHISMLENAKAVKFFFCGAGYTKPASNSNTASVGRPSVFAIDSDDNGDSYTTAESSTIGHNITDVIMAHR